MAGNVYLGRVQNVLPSMEAAFVDIGKGRNAVLYAGEVNWDAAGLEANQRQAHRERAELGRDRAGPGHQGPDRAQGRAAHLADLAARPLPGLRARTATMTGISRKLPDTERARLKKILKEVVPDTRGRHRAHRRRGCHRGGAARRRRAAHHDLGRDQGQGRVGDGGGKKARAAAPRRCCTASRTSRSASSATSSTRTSPSSSSPATRPGRRSASTSTTSLRTSPTALQRWTARRTSSPHYRVDEQIAKAMDRKVWLPSGGSLVIDRTEAMTVVDVNTGKFVGSGGNLEETVTKNNIEAAEEIVRQLRLRDIGGIIVIDFIDMVLESNRDLVVRRLLECLGRDRTKHQVAEVTSLGLVQMTRKRVGSGLIEVFSETLRALRRARHHRAHRPDRQRAATVTTAATTAQQHGGSGAARRSNGRSRGTRPALPARRRPQRGTAGRRQRRSPRAAHAGGADAGDGTAEDGSARRAGSGRDRRRRRRPPRRGRPTPRTHRGRDRSTAAAGRERDASRADGRRAGSSRSRSSRRRRGRPRRPSRRRAAERRAGRRRPPSRTPSAESPEPEPPSRAARSPRTPPRRPSPCGEPAARPPAPRSGRRPRRPAAGRHAPRRRR